MIDKNKKYKTRFGSDVRIYATDGGGTHTVHGAILDTDGTWVIAKWGPLGEWNGTSRSENNRFDLVEVKPRIQREFWLNVYPADGHYGQPSMSKEEVDRSALVSRIACIKITIDCEEGEGLKCNNS